MRLRLLTVTAAATILTTQPSLAQDNYGSAPSGRQGVRYAFDPAARAAWLADCRQRLSAWDSRFRGAAIDNAGPNRDECEAYLDDYYTRYMEGGYYPTYGYSPGAQPTAAAMQAEPECTETVEYVYEDVPAPRKRHIPKRSKVVPDKRVPIG